MVLGHCICNDYSSNLAVGRARQAAVREAQAGRAVETAGAALVLHHVDFVHEPVTGLALQLAGVAVFARRVGYGRHPAGVGGGDRFCGAVDLCRNQFEWRSL